MVDNLVWLTAQRDHYAALRDAAYAKDDWGGGNAHNDWVERYYACIEEITQARQRLAIFSEVLQKRIILAASHLDEEGR